jgi:hypothetical protein
VTARFNQGPWAPNVSPVAKKKSKRRADHPRRPTIVRRDVPPAPEWDAEAQPLIQALRKALYSDHPFDLLNTVAGFLDLTEPHPLEAKNTARMSLPDLVESFEEIDLAATTAALHVIATLTPDDLLTARIRRTLAKRHQPMPRWLLDLSETEVAEVWESRHVQRDGEDYLLDVRLPDGFPLTALVYVDNNVGGLVKDAFLIAEPVSVVTDKMREIADPDTTLEPVDQADARALMEEAIHIGEITVPPFETDTWPRCRPLVRWLVGKLPAGGVVHREEWSDAEQATLLSEFLASSYGAAYDDLDHRSLLDDLLWFGVSQGTGDPLRWSPVNVEVILVDWYPRKVVADVDLLTKLPRLLRDFIRFSHQRRGLRRDLTEETLAAVDRWEPEYQRLIRTDRPQGAQALARMLLDYEGGPWGIDDVAADVGGREALDALDDEPLPDEEFDWDGVPEDLRPKVAEILALCDQNAEEFLDVEHRTANRRLLRRVVEADPKFFRGRASARTSAAAICWMVAHANNSISPWTLTSQELLAPFGVRSTSDRARKFGAALGLPGRDAAGPFVLGSPDLLVGVRRAALIEERDEFR